MFVSIDGNRVHKLLGMSPGGLKEAKGLRGLWKILSFAYQWPSTIANLFVSAKFIRWIKKTIFQFDRNFVYLLFFVNLI